VPSTQPITTQPVASSLPGISRLIAVASKEFPRYSEADVIELTDGRLLLAVGRKSGSDDFAPAAIVTYTSLDGGLTWDDQPREVQGPFDDVGGTYSVSLCRSPGGIHLFFLARGPDAHRDTRVYQIVSTDEGATWGKPQRVSQRGGYHIVNNARVIRTSRGRMIVPIAFTDALPAHHDQQRAFVLFSDDDGLTWKQSNELSPGENKPLMEPGVVECADGSLYMTLRTKMGVLYEARSRDDGATWSDLGPTKLPSPVAPSTVSRDPTSADLWMFWINRGKGTWKQRTPLSLAVSHDHGRTWDAPRDIENDPHHSYGYVSVDVIHGSVLLTYYDWRDEGQAGFVNTSLRQRIIPLAYFHGEATPSAFRASKEPVLKQDGEIVSANSGLLVRHERWRLWYTAGTTGPGGDRLQVCYAESRDRGVTWTSDAKPIIENAYHPSAHRDGDRIALYAWRGGAASGLYRYVSDDDGKTFAADPDTALIAAWWTRAAPAADGRVSNDAFDLLRNERGTWEYFAAKVEKASDPRTIVKADNAAGWIRMIGRATSADGVNFSPVDFVIRPDYAPPMSDPADTQFYGMQVFRRRKFYLGLLHTFHAVSQIIQPEWAWSHDGQSWNRTRVPCISLGDEGNFDSRMIVFGSVVESGDELIWLYAGSNWRHNAYDAKSSVSAIGRATLPLRELDHWLNSLPQP
jgi:hypothetical protein